MSRLKLALALALVGCVASAGAASAATTIGNTAYEASSGIACNDLRIGTEAEYQSHVDGVITSFSIYADAVGGTASFKVVNLNLVPLAPHVTVTATSGQFPITSTGLQAKPVRVPISAGQYIGVWGTGNLHCNSTAGSNIDGGTATFAAPADPAPGFGADGTTTASPRTLVAAKIEPDADRDGFGDETQDGCPSQAGTAGACVAAAGPKPCVVPSLKGKTASAAKSALVAAGCKLGSTKKKKLRKFTKKQKRNRIRSQSVAANAIVPAGTAVTITINTKKKKK